MGFVYETSGQSAQTALLLGEMQGQNAAWSGTMGVSQAAKQVFMPFWGGYTATTNAPPASVRTQDLTTPGGNRVPLPIGMFFGTAGVTVF